MARDPLVLEVRLNLGSGSHPLDGFANLDKENGWRFEDGLSDYEDDSIEGISVSHALMFVELKDWPFVFSEFARVLEPGGVIRITEDATDDRRSPRYGGFEGAVTLTSVALVRDYLQIAGLDSRAIAEGETLFRDRSLIQSWHGGSPKCFFVEATKP